MLATTPTQKKGLTLSQNYNIHHITGIEIIPNNHPTIPAIDLIICHADFDGNVTKLKVDLFADTYAELGAILQALAEDCLKAIVVAKTVEALATE